MTRMLSELLGAREPNFRLSLRELEKSSGSPSADIRLSVNILHEAQAKIRELGLDPQNTTGEELFETLKTRLLADEQRLRELLGLAAGSSVAEVVSSLQKFINSLEIPHGCFALKHSVAKKLLKNNPPQRAMKRLGYRSLDSMLKHEPVSQIYAAATMYESGHWHKNLQSAYEQLKPGDFEARPISLNCPKTRRWQELSADFAATRHHNNLAFKELGAVVLLPAGADLPALALTTTLSVIASFNNIRITSSFIKLQQVKPDFGKLVALSSTGEPYTSASLGGFALPWRFLHGFFASVHEVYHPELFEPHVQPEDLELANAEAALAAKMPALEFWLNTSKLAYVDKGQPVSLNMLDVALAAANGLDFENRVAKHVRQQVWFELLSRYLSPGNLQTVTEQLSEELTGAEPEHAQMLKDISSI